MLMIGIAAGWFVTLLYYKWKIGRLRRWMWDEAMDVTTPKLRAFIYPDE